MTKSTKVFVVDDDPSARRGLSRLLRAAGHDTLAFASASAFLEAFEAGSAGCIVLDAWMPGMSGEELQAELEALGAHPPIIVVTGGDDPEAKQRALNMKAAGFFRKPVDGTALLDAIGWARGCDANDGNSTGGTE